MACFHFRFLFAFIVPPSSPGCQSKTRIFLGICTASSAVKIETRLCVAAID